MKKLLLLSILFTSCQAGLADYEYVIKNEGFREDVLKSLMVNMLSYLMGILILKKLIEILN